jgi:diguanylate cyclase (GGDEF)-like protein/PAS domain S-box-containing protein
MYPLMRTIVGFSLGLCAALVSWLMLPGSCAWAQSLSVRHLTAEQGLSNRYVNALAQDANGHIWIGTSAGLNRYDGQRVVTYLPSPEAADGLPSEYIPDLTLDAQQRLWMATGLGLSRYRPQHDDFINYPLQSADGNDVLDIRRIQSDARGRIWLATWSGLAYFNPNNETLNFPFRDDQANIPLPAATATTLHKDRQGHFWTAFYDASLVRIDPTSDQVQRWYLKDLIPGIDEDHHIQSIHSATGRLFLAGHFGVVVLRLADMSLQKHFTVGASDQQLQPAYWTMDMLLDRSQRLWVGSDVLLQRIDLVTGDIERFSHVPALRSSLSDNSIAALMQDRDGLVWIATHGDGVNIFNPVSEAFNSLNPATAETPGHAENSIWDIQADNDEQLWVSSEYSLYSVDREGNTQHFKMAVDNGGEDIGLPESYPAQLALDSDGSLLIATTDGMVRMDPSSRDVLEHYQHDPDLPGSIADDLVYDILRDDQERLWVATYNGLSLLKPGAEGFVNYRAGEESGLRENIINVVDQLEDGSIVVGTSGGVYRLDENSGQFIGASLRHLTGGPELRYVSAIAYDAERGTLLVGTGGSGLLEYDWPVRTDSLEKNRYTKQDGLPDNHIWSLLPGDDGRYWISTNDGMAQFDPDSGNFVKYNTALGLPDNEFNEAAAYRHPSGELFFGGIRGVVHFRPQAVQNRLQATTDQVIFTQVSIDGEVLPLDGSITEWPHDFSRLTATFSVPEYTAPSNQRFRYRLDPVYQNWVELGSRSEIELVNLSPGDYTLQVEGRSASGNWSARPASISWRIKPPLWASRSAYLAYAGAAFVLILLLLYARRQRRLRREQVIAAIDNHRSRLHLALWASNEGLWEWHAEDNLVHRSLIDSDGRLREISAHSLDQDRHNVLDSDLPTVSLAWDALLNGETDVFEVEFQRLNTDNQRVWVRECGRVVERNAYGLAVHVSGTFKDINRERENADHARLFGQAFDHTSEGVVILDAQRRVVAINRAFCRISGFAREHVLGQPSSFLSSDHHDKFFYRDVWRTVHENGHWSGEVWERKADDTPYPCWGNISVVVDEKNQISHYVAVLSDITERKKAEYELHKLARFDPLTELPNRSFLRERLEQALSRAERNWEQLGVLFLDLDRFKQINDSLGHNVGDRLLQLVGMRLKRCVRKHDTVARISGDEFVIVLEGIPDAQAAAHVAEKILESLVTPMQLEGNEATVSTSIGISLYPHDGSDSASLLKNADTAMYHAKSEGRNNFQFYAPEMNASAFERLRLENALRQAVSKNELELHYQPRFNINDQSIVGAEALLRWRHPTRGMVSPGEFIPVAEETGLIRTLGDWVCQRALQDLAAWLDSDLLPEKFRLSINLSPRQLIHEDLSERILGIMQTHQVSAKHLELEITENVLMDHKDRGVAQLEKLEAMGLCVSVDDFGTGYSSMSYLKELPINVLKIDQSFVRDIEGDPQDAAIVRTIIQLAHSLSLEVVAEGVESKGQLDFLRQHGCHLVQGFLLARPMPHDDFVGRLTATTLPDAAGRD